jgi:hypothetical protein
MGGSSKARTRSSIVAAKRGRIVALKLRSHREDAMKIQSIKLSRATIDFERRNPRACVDEETR